MLPHFHRALLRNGPIGRGSGAQLRAGLPIGSVASLPTPRVGLGLATQVASPSGGSTANHLYAIGGFDGQGHALNTVEIYDFATNSWTNGTPMPTPRGYLAVVAGTDGNVYAIGGTDGQQPLTTVEVYNPSKNSWSVSCMPLAGATRPEL